MPELPEVETTLRGIEPHVCGSLITGVVVRRGDLRLPVTRGISSVAGHRITGAARRSKYILLDTGGGGTLLIHLGMSGSLRVAKVSDEWKTHDHIGLTLENGIQIRFHDPRRFGLFLRIKGDPSKHALLKHLGPEPLEDTFTGTVLHTAFANRSVTVKSRIMNAEVVVGIGNIYASEALFRAGILPRTPCKRLSPAKSEKLAEAIRVVLTEAIHEGGTTLRDFLNSDGNPGYFQQRLFVYGRKNEPCGICGTPIRHAMLAGRSTYWCPRCQK